MLVVLAASYFLVSHHEKIQIEHVRQDIIHDKVEPLSREWEEKYAKLEEENEILKNESADKATFLDTKVQLEKQLRDGEKLRETQEDDIKHLTQYKQKMKDDIQLMSKTALLEKCVRIYFERLCLLLW
jgi:transcription initiation factor IIF auxiliary subunit